MTEGTVTSFLLGALLRNFWWARVWDSKAVPDLDAKFSHDRTSHCEKHKLNLTKMWYLAIHVLFQDKDLIWTFLSRA